jgi:hypothetical protein
MRVLVIIGLLMFFSSESMAAKKSVSYNSNGATSGTAPATQTTSNYGTVTVSNNSGNLAILNQTFSGWDTSNTATVATYQPGDQLTLNNDNVNLFAVWTPRPTVTAGQSFSVNQGATANTNVGTVATTGGTPTSFNIASGNTDSIFSISTSGAITVANTKTVPTSPTSYTLSITATNAAGTSTPQNVTITVNPPSFSIADLNVTEGNNGYHLVNIPVTLSYLDGNTHTVNYTTSNLTAIATTSTTPGDYNTSSGTLTFNSTTTVQYVPVYINGDTIPENDENFSITLSNPTFATISKATSTVIILDDDNIGYCQTNNLSNGFHIVDPSNDITKSFEIYCYNNKDYIALPIKNNSNNFVFKNNTLASTNYYSEADTNSSSFDAIEINAYTLKVQAKSTIPLPQTISGTGITTFNTMGSSFSNINLTGTPFAIDWSNTTITNCTQSKLRTAYYGQDVKINSLNYDKAICNVTNMQLKLLDDYTYLQYNSSEVLQPSCKTMAEAVPSTFLQSSSIKGHYWISPLLNDRTYGQTNIKSTQRPIVSYCWYQTDLNWVWTFSLAMDGKVTSNKNDLLNKSDTCSQFGLVPFTPNNEDTFERVRAYLYNIQPQWNNYTGTIEEKVKTFTSQHYYLSTEQSSILWPYGSFGVYFPYKGNHDSSGNTKTWGGSNSNTPGWMSGSPMHNIQTITQDYPRVTADGGNTNRNYYSWGTAPALSATASKNAYSTIDTTYTDGSYPYSATMGAKGWRSVLQDLNKTDEWFISRSGAGMNFDKTGNYPYYEPNGNYTAGAWLNFLYDSNGRVRHTDDWDNNYPYYDYMCMAPDNYDFTTRYGLLNGPFKAIEHTTASGSELNNLALTTKIVKAPLAFDIILLNDSLSAIQPDRNISVGIFLDDTYMVGSTETAKDIHYFGDIQLDGQGTFNSIKTTGRFELPASSWPSGTNKWTSANKRLFLKFKYCSNDKNEWTDCWTLSGDTATCKTGQTANCQTADSDDFAVRPDRFDFSLSGSTPYKAGVGYNITFSAKDADNVNTLNFNQNVPFTYKETKSGCINGDYNTTLNVVPMVDGSNIMNLAYSEVGVINVKLQEIVGSEFALVDANDTSDTQRLITPYDQNWTYTPDHFSLASSSFNNRGNGFTYISSDLNMSSDLNVTTVAQNAKNIVTKNYSSACYAKQTSYQFSYTPLIINPNASLSNMKYLETKSSTTATIPITSSGASWSSSMPNTVFSTDNNGTAKLDFKINFDRNVTKPVDPFIFNLKDINVTDTDTVQGHTTLNQNTTFLYGRTHAPRYRFTGNSGDAKIYYETYCGSDGNKTMLPTGSIGSSDSVGWYLNVNHNTTTDGNITTITEKNLTNTVTNSSALPLTTSNGISTTALVYHGTTFPYKTTIQDTASSWLIYNPYDSTATTNEFEVEFYGGSNTWTGHNNTTTTTDSVAAPVTGKRILW